MARERSETHAAMIDDTVTQARQFHREHGVAPRPIAPRKSGRVFNTVYKFEDILERQLRLARGLEEFPRAAVMGSFTSPKKQHVHPTSMSKSRNSDRLIPADVVYEGKSPQTARARQYWPCPAIPPVAFAAGPPRAKPRVKKTLSIWDPETEPMPELELEPEPEPVIDQEEGYWTSRRVRALQLGTILFCPFREHDKATQNYFIDHFGDRRDAIPLKDKRRNILSRLLKEIGPDVSVQELCPWIFSGINASVDAIWTEFQRRNPLWKYDAMLECIRLRYALLHAWGLQEGDLTQFLGGNQMKDPRWAATESRMIEEDRLQEYIVRE